MNILRTVVLSSALVAVAGLTLAGPLDPPGGPITSTNKTLQEVEPRTAITAANTPGDSTNLIRITAPGSYYLTSNVNGASGKNGINILASGVTLDLNGFELLGVPGSLDGVTVGTFGLTNIAVVNGSIRNWGGDGVDMITNGAANGRAENLRVSGNAGNGISLSSAGSASHCFVRLNTQHGIFASGPAVFSDCTVSNNSGNGINCSAACSVTNCTLYLNSTGISTSAGCNITNCIVYGNTTNGISVSSGCVVAGCTVRGNAFDGIQAAVACLIRDNACEFNGNGGTGSGIHITSTGNRIEGNNCTNADVGISIDSSRNIIIRNTCGGNANNWSIVAGNAVAPIVNATINPALITGNTYTGSLGSTDPNANFTY